CIELACEDIGLKHAHTGPFARKQRWTTRRIAGKRYPSPRPCGHPDLTYAIEIDLVCPIHYIKDLRAVPFRMTESPSKKGLHRIDRMKLIRRLHTITDKEQKHGAVVA